MKLFAEHESRYSPRRDQGGSVLGKTAQAIDSISNANEIGLFRKASCACGGGCPACQSQSNLKVSQPNDSAEIEADQMADRVMRMSIDDAKPKAAAANKANTIHRKCNACENEEEGAAEKPVMRKEAFASGASPPPSETPPSIRNVINSGGQPLDLETRNFFEPRFGIDLGHVRTFSDSSAGQSARAINAKAYTLGSSIVFGSGEYQPETESGKQLIAHELAHTMQGHDPSFGGPVVHRKGLVPGAEKPVISVPASDCTIRDPKKIKFAFDELINNVKKHPGDPSSSYCDKPAGKILGLLRVGDPVTVLDFPTAPKDWYGVCAKRSDMPSQIMYVAKQHVGIKQAVSKQQSASVDGTLSQSMPATPELLRDEIESIRLRLGLGNERDSTNSCSANEFIPVSSEENILYQRLLVLEAEQGQNMCLPASEQPVVTEPGDEFSEGQSIPGPVDDIATGIGATPPESMTGTQLENEINDIRFILDVHDLDPDNPIPVGFIVVPNSVPAYERLVVIETEYFSRRTMSDEVRETMGKIADEQRESGMSTADKLLLGAGFLNPVTAPMAAIGAGAAALGNPVEDFATGFVPAFLAGAVIELPRDAFAKLKAELDEHPILFNGGVMVGLPVGALWGLYEMLAGIYELGKLAVEFSPIGMTYSSIKDTYRQIFDSAKFSEEKKAEAAKRQAIAEALYEVVTGMLADPAFMIEHGRELGEMAGRSAGQWFNKDFMPMSPERKGFTIGMIEGRIIFEIAALFLGPEEWLIRGMAAVGEATRFAAMFRRMVSKLPALEKLIQLQKTSKADGLIGKAADEIGEGGKLVDEAAEGAAHLADEAGTLGKITPETTEFFKNKPELKQAWIDNPVAAQALKFCESPCWPENIKSVEQIKALDKFIRRAKEGKQVINRRALHEALEKLPESEVDDYIRVLNDGLDARLKPNPTVKPAEPTENINDPMVDPADREMLMGQGDEASRVTPEDFGHETEVPTTTRVDFAEDHHIATRYREANREIFERAGLSIDDDLNLIKDFQEHGQLRGWYRWENRTYRFEMRGHHPAYNAWVTKTLREAVPPGIAPDVAMGRIQTITQRFSEIIRTNPEVLSHGPEILPEALRIISY